MRPGTPLTAAPTLSTDRLILRGPERGDLAPFMSFMTSAPSMVAQGEAVSAQQAWFGFLAGIGHWHWHGFGFFTVVSRDTEAPVGRVGLIRHEGWPQIELAWHLYEGAEGRGFATEAARRVATWAQEALQAGPLVSYIDRTNLRSQAVARRLGARIDGARPPHEPEAEIWRHPLPRHTAET